MSVYIVVNIGDVKSGHIFENILKRSQGDNGNLCIKKTKVQKLHDTVPLKV